ncbi:asparagine synthetase B [Maioricimonas rarisocia]|uniref:Asparagine synthetase B n=1 Tax=Maioricimonas rarisocia TaxID=2528026 RepID=A0A517Z4B0_9PLAN|nr:asparagine synthase-related protein [Maioricimonas rarisocia]QDU37323.1 asparagine synthetase B [Maioricimonas rarisocia]
MHQTAPVERVVNLLDPAGNVLLNMSVEEAVERVGSGDPERVRQIDGQFALMHKEGIRIRMARSIGRPMRYFLAKRAEGPCLVIAERIDAIRDFLRSEDLDGQFHPSYTRMVPAHHIVELNLVGCPDPNPQNTRFLAPERNRLGSDVDEIGRAYIGAVAEEVDRWLDRIEPDAPIGVLFSGGIDSGAVFLTVYHCLLKRGESPSRLKAFCLTVEGQSADAEQARRFLEELDLGMFLETVDVPLDALDYREAIRVVEDYKPLDVQAATVALALCRGIRERYPDWKYLVDGDGGDENLKDYPIEENPELTIRSVLNNLMLYHEGWGVDAVKHSLTYSGGQSRGHVRTFAPARTLGFSGFSPYALPNVIEVAEGIPFIELTDWDHDRLYALKGEVVRRGVEAVTGITMPVFEKRRFQNGAVDGRTFEDVFPSDEREYRRAFAALYE